MLYTNWKLTLVFLTVGPVIGFVVSYASKRFRRISKRIQGSMGDITHVASESITGYRVVRTFGGEDYEQERFRDVSERNLKQSLKMASTQAIGVPVIQVLVAVAIAALVWTMLAPEIRGEMTADGWLLYHCSNHHGEANPPGNLGTRQDKSGRRLRHVRNHGRTAGRRPWRIRARAGGRPYRV